MGGRQKELAVEQMYVRTDRWRDGRTEERQNKPTDGQTDGWMDRRTDAKRRTKTDTDYHYSDACPSNRHLFSLPPLLRYITIT